MMISVLDNQLVFLDIIHGKRHPDHIRKLKTTDYR